MNSEILSKDLEKKVKPNTAAHCLTNRQATGETRKMVSCFTLLRRITRLKTVNSDVRSRIHSPTWKVIPRRVHATVTNPAWITHLLRTIFANSDVECILRAKTLQYILQLHLTGMGRWRDPAKYQEAAIAIASAKWKIGSRPFPNEEYIQLSQIVPTWRRLEVLKFEFGPKNCLKTLTCRLLA